MDQVDVRLKTSSAASNAGLGALENRFLRPRNLRDAYAQLLTRNARYPVFVTIQPNFGSNVGDAAVRRARPGFQAYYADETWRMLDRLLYRLDALHRDCRAPEYLPPRLRFQGIAVMEKRRTNPHLHMLMTFEDALEQVLGYMFLLYALDNVPAVKWRYATDRDKLREAKLWHARRSQGWRDQFGPSDSCLTELCKMGTAKVLPVHTDQDLERVALYMAKELKAVTPESLASRTFEQASDDYFDFRELRQFHSPKGLQTPARLYTIDPENPRSLILNLDKPLKWRTGRDQRR